MGCVTGSIIVVMDNCKLFVSEIDVTHIICIGIEPLISKDPIQTVHSLRAHKVLPSLIIGAGQRKAF
jgi:hypothetical protein